MATVTPTEPTVTLWHGLYKSSWKGDIVDAAFQHPAKFSKALIFKIIEHAITEGWVRQGDTVIDPFGGVGLGGLPCALRGLQHLAVELEPRFVALANGAECGGDLAKHDACPEPGEHGPHHLLGNLELWQRKYGVLPQWKQPVMLQGDSRNLCQIIEAHADLLVSSSPYAASVHSPNSGPIDFSKVKPHKGGGMPSAQATPGCQGWKPLLYGTTDGQLAALPPGSLDAALAGGADLAAASPPHGPDALGHHRGAEADAKEWRTKSIHGTIYSTSPTNLGNMKTGNVDLVASSPPYADGCTHTGGADPQPQHVQGGPLRWVQYGADCAVSSPPFHDTLAKVSLKGIGSEDYGERGTTIEERRFTYPALDHEAFGSYLKMQRQALALSKAEVDRQLGTNTAYSFWEGRRGSRDQWRIPLPSIYRKLKAILQLDERFDAVLLSTQMVQVEHRALKMGHRNVDYGTHPAQLGTMPPGDVAAVVQGDLVAASPPWEASLNGHPHRQERTQYDALQQRVVANGKGHGGQLGPSIGQTYGDHPAQMGNTQGTTFWEAARQIVSETFKLLRPGAHAIWVTKMYIRDSQLVDFPGDWRKLCEAVGFQTVHIHLAMLVERRVETHLFEGEHTYEEWKESFFRRISRKRTGIGVEFETVICQVKPLTAAPMPPDEAWQQLPLVAECSISSPAYADTFHGQSEATPRAELEKRFPHWHTGGQSQIDTPRGYGTSPAQLGAMKVGSLDCALASPPYAGRGEVLGTHNGIDWTKTTGTGQRLTPGREMGRYSANPLNLGNLIEGQRPE